MELSATQFEQEWVVVLETRFEQEWEVLLEPESDRVWMVMLATESRVQALEILYHKTMQAPEGFPSHF